MATVYSAEYQCSSYIKGRVRVEYSGTSGTAYYEYKHTYGGHTGYSGTFKYKITGASEQTKTWSNETVSTSWTAKFSQSVPINISGETKSFYVSGYSYNQMSGSVKIPTQATAPSGLSVTVNSVGETSAVLSGSISSYGTPVADNSYIELAINNSSTYGSSYRRVISANKATSMSNITIDNNSSTGSSVLNIRPNTKYWPGIYATNRSKEAMITGTSFITLPASFTNISIETDNANANVTFTRGAEGTDSTVTTYYSLDNSTWIECTSPFSFTKEESGNYTLYLKATNSTGSTTGSASYAIEAANVYIGDADGKAKKVTKLYIGDSDGKAKQIYKLYIGDADGKARKVVG